MFLPFRSFTVLSRSVPHLLGELEATNLAFYFSAIFVNAAILSIYTMTLVTNHKAFKMRNA